MEDIIGITLEHAGPIGVALCVLAFYLLHRFDMLPTYRARIEWVEPEPMQEQAKQLVQVGQRMQSSEGKERRIVHRPRRRLTRYERLEALADSGCDTWAEYDGLR